MDRLTGWPAFWAVALAAELAALAHGFRADPGGYLPGDAGLYAAAAHSLVHDHDLDLLNQCCPGRATLADALPDLEGEHAGEFGLSKRGTLTLKQSPVFALAGVPGYALFGPPGLLLTNLAILNALLAGVARLVGGPAGRVAALLLLTTTPFWRFAFDYSPDLWLTALLVWSVWAAGHRRGLLAGLLLGLAVCSKVYVAAFAAPVALIALAFRPTPKSLASLLLGGLLGLTPGALFQQWQYGTPWATGYERQLAVVGGQVTVAGHVGRFTEPPLQGLANILFDRALGLLPTAPLYLLWPIAAVMLMVAARRLTVPERVAAACALGVVVLNLAVFAAYNGWHSGSSAGNRYQFPGLAFAAVLIGLAGRNAWPSPAGFSSVDSRERPETG